MTVNEKLYGFIIDRIRPVDELEGQLIEMTHEKTGLQLAWIKRGEENKTFGIAFKTLPSNDTGVFHILEHSVLCGSEKYRVKEPFVELLKNSMNTFLNAMTFSDQTVFPVSSRNHKDFLNLVRVYLDAVFQPLIYEKPEIFYQEGWHYEIDENGDASYKGVVFNEMKGAMVAPEELEDDALHRALFPDSTYRYNSGGAPEAIPDLTYEEFLEAHKKYYSPSNARVFLDGDIDIDQLLKVMDEEYLASMEKGECMENPPLQQTVDGGTQHVRYELGRDEDEHGRTRLAWGWVFADYTEIEKISAVHILSDILCGSNQAPLCKAVLSRGLAETVNMGAFDGSLQAVLKIEAVNLESEKQDEVEAVIFGELERIAEEGLDPKLIEASLAEYEFGTRERDFGTNPQGIIFGLQMLEFWLYGGDPISKLEVGDLFDSLREKAAKGYFEQIIKEVILDNPHRTKVVIEPSKTVGEERRAAEEAKIAAAVSSWSEKERDQVCQSQEALIKWQSEPDTEEALASLPHLKLSDIDVKPEKLPVIEGMHENIKTLYHDINCSGIVNVSLFFDADDLNEEEISLLSFLTDIISEMRTEHYSEAELDNEIRLTFGNLNFYVSSYMVKQDRKKCRIKMGATFGVLESKLERAAELVSEILLRTKFDAEVTALDLLRPAKSNLLQTIVMSGASVGTGRLAAQNSAAGVSGECSGGYEYYRWLCDQEENWDWDVLGCRLGKLLDELVCSNRLTVSMTGGNQEMLEMVAAKLYSELPDRGPRRELNSVVKPWGCRREGIVIPADISFACAGGVLTGFDEGYGSFAPGFNGKMRIASKILTFAYLWNVIRVQGGAYGTGFSIKQDGMASCYSYRDPSAVSSLQAFETMGDFLESMGEECDDLSGFIIGAVSDVLPLLTPRAKGMKADGNYFMELTDEYNMKLLQQMLETKPSDLVQLAQQLRDTFKECGICVIGSSEQMAECNPDEILTI